MLARLMKKAIKVFEDQTKGQGLEIRNVYVWDMQDKKAQFKIECNLLALNKYYYVLICVENDSKEFIMSDLREVLR